MQIKKETLIWASLIVLVIIVSYFILFYKPINTNSNEKIYSFSDTYFNYSQSRTIPKYEMSFNSTNGSLEIYNLAFQSRNFLNYTTKIYGLLFIPKSDKPVPGLVLLPGGSVPKENEAGLARIIANLGYAVLTIDQRGIGQTGGYYLGFQDDYKVFASGNEPVQHLSVYDALASYDVLKQIKGVDKDNMAIAGESMGGRYAIIAAAIDKRLKGAP